MQSEYILMQCLAEVPRQSRQPCSVAPNADHGLFFEPFRSNKASSRFQATLSRIASHFSPAYRDPLPPLAAISQIPRLRQTYAGRRSAIQTIAARSEAHDNSRWQFMKTIE
jgi:hypothetical protein